MWVQQLGRHSVPSILKQLCIQALRFDQPTLFFYCWFSILPECTSPSFSSRNSTQGSLRVGCTGYYPICCCGKTPYKGNLGKSEATAHQAGKSAASESPRHLLNCFCSQEAERDECWSSACCLVILPSLLNGATSSQGMASHSINLI